MDTAQDILPRHALSFALLKGERDMGFNARCVVCGDLFDHFEDTDGVCAPRPRDEETR
jgi:hypothetical protein